MQLSNKACCWLGMMIQARQQKSKPAQRETPEEHNRVFLLRFQMNIEAQGIDEAFRRKRWATLCPSCPTVAQTVHCTPKNRAISRNGKQINNEKSSS